MELVTVCVVARNEENYLPGLLEDLTAQQYPHGKMEIVLVDSGSTDGTKAVMLEFADGAAQHGWARVEVADNPGVTQPCGWNVAIKAARGDVIFRLDAHASVPPDFVEKSVRNIENGEDVAGGQQLSMMDDSTPWKHTLNAVETSPFGSGAASYRREGEKKYESSLFHAAYRKEVFDKVGGFDERLTRTEDNEIHYRMRAAGYRLLYDPDVVTYQHTRNTFSKMIKQKCANGWWVGLTTGVCPRCLELHHFVPFAFVVALILFAVLAGLVTVWPLATLLGVYFTAAVAMTVVAAVKNGFTLPFLVMPFLFFCMHAAYGVGTLAGLVYMPVWKRKTANRNGA